MSEKEKVILCGFNWAGCKALKLLLDNGYDVFVYTTKSPDYINSLEAYCVDNNIPYSLDKISVDNIPFKPIFIASIYYRYIISSDIITLVDQKIFNLHPSLLPAYKGCSSLTWAMINGEGKCGYTYHFIDKGVDTGNIILQREIEIEEFDTQVTLYHRVMFEAMKDFLEAISLVLIGYKGIEQNNNLGTYYKRGCPYNGTIEDNWDLVLKKRFIRSMIYPPMPPAKYEDGRVAFLNDFI